MRKERVQQGTELDSVLLLSFQAIRNKNIFEMTVKLPSLFLHTQMYLS